MSKLRVKSHFKSTPIFTSYLLVTVEMHLNKMDFEGC